MKDEARLATAVAPLAASQSDGGRVGEALHVRVPDHSRAKLKAGPGRSPEGVAADQKARLHRATVELIAEGGHEGLTATAIAGAAGVSKRTFYEHFESKDDCFLATYDRIVHRTARAVLAARHGQKDWDGCLRAGFAAFAREVAERPLAARLALVDIFDAGPRGAERMRHTEGLFEALVLESFAGAEDGLVLSPMLAKAIVEGCTRVARARILAGREAELPGQSPELMLWALSLRHTSRHDLAPGPATPVLRRTPVPSPGHFRSSPPVDPAVLLDDERRMILRVAGTMAAEQGYGSLTVSRIRAAAGISRRRFDAHFDDTEDCFLAAVELIAGRSMAASRHAFLQADTWPRAVQCALDTLCARVADDPILVGLCFLEVDAAGHVAARWRTDYVSTLAAWLRGSAPPEQRPSMLEAEASVGAGWALMHHYVTTGRAPGLRELAPTLSFLVLAPVLGAGLAIEEIEAGPARVGRAATRQLTAKQHKASTDRPSMNTS